MTTRILIGNSLEILPTLEKNSVHCSVTSPPYYGLRKYAGDQQCDWPEVEYAPMPGLPPITVEAMTCALGHEPTIEAYVGHLVAVYREVWRVLRDDGVAWIVMGDSYAGGGGGNYSTSPKQTKHGQHITNVRNRDSWLGSNNVKQGDLMLVPHRLALALQAAGWTVRNDCLWAKKAPMPESVAGWRWQRHRVKIEKSDRATNPYQSGAGTRQGAGVASRAQREAYYEQGKGAAKWVDCPGCPKCEATGGYVLRRGSWRHTRAHEVVFMLTKKMGYWSDQEAVREALNTDCGWYKQAIGGEDINKWRYAKYSEMDLATGPQARGGHSQNEPRDTKYVPNHAGRNPRSVLSPDDADPIWGYLAENYPDVLTAYLEDATNPIDTLSPSPEPFPGKHFAVYPTGLIEPLIKATCPARCCPECGQGWSPVVERGEPRKHHGENKISDHARDIAPVRTHGGRHGTTSVFYTGESNSYNVLGYRPTCGCGAGLLPDDLEVISSPTGKRMAQDPSLVTGRAGFNRPRGPDEGSRPITRYEQRKYAEQLKNSPYRDKMEVEAGSAFAHYIRTDKSGARPAPPDLLERWIEQGWLERIQVPESKPLEPVPGVCLDPFFGAGTTGLVCDRLGLDCIGIDISERYVVDLALPRIKEDAPLLADVVVEVI